jgi:hypothetical protein
MTFEMWLDRAMRLYICVCLQPLSAVTGRVTAQLLMNADALHLQQGYNERMLCLCAPCMYARFLPGVALALRMWCYASLQQPQAVMSCAAAPDCSIHLPLVLWCCT